MKEQITTSGRRTAMLSRVSRTGKCSGLADADECLRMPGPKKNAQGEIEEAGDMVIYVAGYPAIYGKQPCTSKTQCSRHAPRSLRPRSATACAPSHRPSRKGGHHDMSRILKRIAAGVVIAAWPPCCWPPAAMPPVPA